jgi:hypothetical protein
MNRTDIDQLMAAFLSETISPAEQQLLDAWVNECADNKRYYSQSIK